MAQKLIAKELVNTRLANNYGGWIYCDVCSQTLGYLCYVTYNNVKLEYKCNCGNRGSLHLAVKDTENTIISSKKLVVIKNRLCCPEDHLPLITVLKQKLDFFSYQIVCKECNQEFCDEGDKIQ